MKLTHFLIAMQKELDANDHKDGWEGWDIEYLLERARQELDELDEAVHDDKPSARRILSEAADVANFCYMIADNECSARDPQWQTPKESDTEPERVGPEE